MPVAAKQRMASFEVHTIGSSLSLKDVFSTTSAPVIFSNSLISFPYPGLVSRPAV